MEHSSDLASLREAVALLQRAMSALGQEKADAEARAAAAELQVEEFVVKAAAAEAAVSAMGVHAKAAQVQVAELRVQAECSAARVLELEAKVAEQRAGAHAAAEAAQVQA